MPIDIIKRQGKRPTEAFQPTKLRSSVIAVCLSVKAPVGEAERIAGRVTDAVLAWSSKKSEVTSADIRHQAAKHLEKLHQQAGHIYKHHRQIF